MIAGELGEALTERRKGAGAGVGAETSQPLGLGSGKLWERDFGQEFWQGCIHLECKHHMTVM